MKNSTIEYRPMWRTGVQVSQLCLGCMMFGEKTSPEDSEAIITRAIDSGINMLDTANVYATRGNDSHYWSTYDGTVDGQFVGS